MKWSRFPLLALALVLGCREHAASPNRPPPDTTPNDTLPGPARYDIVLILTDDQRHATLQAMPKTRALIFAPGVEFLNAFATTPLCCPSRASILTGLYTHNHGVLTNVPPLGGAVAFRDTSTLATWLMQSGYRTALFGKYLNTYLRLRPWPYKPPGWSVWNAFKTEGFDRSVLVDDSVELALGPAPSEYSTDFLAGRAVEFIQSTPDSQRFFLYFAPYAPHTPATPAIQDRGTFSSLPPWRPPGYDEDVSDKPAWVQRLAPMAGAKADSNDAFVQAQYESLQSVDRAVEQIVQALAERGRLDSTVIIFASDNGMSWGEHRHVAKNCPYEECIRVPLAIRAPGVPPRQDDHMITLVDLAPTIAHFANVPLPRAVNGMNLAPLLANPATAWRSEVLIEVPVVVLPAPMTPFTAIRTTRYLYVELTSGERELYDLVTDPFQLDNSINDPAHSALITELSGRLALLRLQ